MKRIRRKESDSAADALLEKALEIALRAHAGQKHRMGGPYILHPLRVLLRLDRPLERVAAALHDVIEDSEIALDDLRAAGFPEEVVGWVDLLTRRPGQSKKAYYARLIADPVARRIKLADLADNIAVREGRRLAAAEARRLEGYRKWRAELRAREARDARPRTGGAVQVCRSAASHIFLNGAAPSGKAGGGQP